ncbi:hypothetical protein SO694_00002147 [Aureococcus anophagefferens]|uniref:Uncharacterized protein n=1 Tax=Aureococcus anophagefferens TaxID=44056 RepID=A0ABR1GC38_AURAN
MVREIKKRQKKKEKRVKKMRKRLRADLEKKNPPASPRKRRRSPGPPSPPSSNGTPERALREKLDAGEIEDDAQSSSTFTSGPPDLDTYEMEQALAKPDQDVPGGFEGAGHGGALRTTDTEKSLVRTVVSTLAATLDAAESARVAEPPQRAVRKNWRMPDFDYGDPIATATTIDAGPLHRADPFAEPFARPLLPVAALRLDLARAQGDADLHVPLRARCDYATRDAHLVACKAFKEAWEEALRRLVEEFTAGAASTRSGAPYVPGDSGSDQVTEVVRNAAFRGASRQKSREDVHFEDSDLKGARSPR